MALLSAAALGAVAVEYAMLVGRWCSETRSTAYVMERVRAAGGLEPGRRRACLPPLMLSRRRPDATFFAEESTCITIAYQVHRTTMRDRYDFAINNVSRGGVLAKEVLHKPAWRTHVGKI